MKYLNCDLALKRGAVFYWRTLCLLCCSLITPIAAAGPWVNPGDEVLRHHIQSLADAGIIKVPVNTWPLMWSGIKQNLEDVNAGDLTDGQRVSLRYVRFALRRDTGSDVRFSWRTDVRQDPHLFTDFADSQRDKAETSLSADWVGDRLAGRLKASWTDDVNGDADAKLDGSYLSLVLGNWVFSAGEIERWWGPGWQNSLILGTNARPTPGVSLQRNQAKAFETPLLSWLGPWTFETFMSQLESDRAVSEALLWGFRVTLRPFSALEIGLTRTAQWGGEGRPQDWSTFGDLLLGRDNRGDDGIEQSNEPGNQLGGFDWRLSGTFWGDTGLGFYGQWIGEDEATGAPSRYVYLMGVDASVVGPVVHQRFSLEFSDTTAEGYKGNGSDLPNYAYEHGIYSSGYRYRNRSLGASTDNDSRMLTFSHDVYAADDHQFSWSVSRVELNRDGIDRALPGGSTVGYGQRTDLWLADARYSFLFDPWQFTIGLDYQSEDLIYAGESIGGVGGYLAWEARW